MVMEILKLPGENNAIYRVKPTWQENSFQITFLLENSSAWHAEVTEEQLTKLAKDRAQNINEYYETIKQCLSKPETQFNFDLKETNNGGNREFSIKRKIGGRTVLFFSIKLVKVNFQESVFNLIDELLENNIELGENLKRIEKNQNVLVDDKNKYVDKLTELIELKTNWEQEMYSNFLLVLNEKKSRIKFLTEILTHKNIDPDEVVIPKTLNAARKSPQKQEKRLEILSESEPESEYETDKEDEGMDIEEVPSPKPSTSEYALDLDDDEPSQPVLRLPKLVKSTQEILFVKKVKEPSNSVANVITQETEEIATQEPYLSTQERIDRM